MKINKQQGFTIVELLIVIVVIGILAALVITTFTGIQQKARDTERTTDIKAVHGQLEAYYAQNGAYPALAELNDASWRDTNLPGLDDEAVADPKDTSATPVFATSATANQYSYTVLPATCTTAGADCTSYTLSATLEEDGSNYEKTNL